MGRETEPGADPPRSLPHKAIVDLVASTTNPQASHVQFNSKECQLPSWRQRALSSARCEALILTVGSFQKAVDTQKRYAPGLGYVLPAQPWLLALDVCTAQSPARSSKQLFCNCLAMGIYCSCK
eukprot:5196221-Amphidinium_carterae.1